jgi:uncharacterized protein YigA (DUF484 family)
MKPSSGMNPITEDDIANYLANTPDFFARHSELLAAVQLTSPHSHRTVSLQERQAEMLREKIKALEHRLMDMVRHGNENVILADRLQRWARNLLQVRYGAEAFAEGVSADAKSFASSLTQPYCGVNSGFEAVSWLADGSTALSLALIPLREGAINSAAPAFGMLVLASPDPQRYQSGMGTDFLERIAELASAALSRLRHD